MPRSKKRPAPPAKLQPDLESWFTARLQKVPREVERHLRREKKPPLSPEEPLAGFLLALDKLAPTLGKVLGRAVMGFAHDLGIDRRPNLEYVLAKSALVDNWPLTEVRGFRKVAWITLTLDITARLERAIGAGSYWPTGASARAVGQFLQELPSPSARKVGKALTRRDGGRYLLRGSDPVEVSLRATVDESQLPELFAAFAMASKMRSSLLSAGGIDPSRHRASDDLDAHLKICPPEVGAAFFVACRDTAGVEQAEYLAIGTRRPETTAYRHVGQAVPAALRKDLRHQTFTHEQSTRWQRDWVPVLEVNFGGRSGGVSRLNKQQMDLLRGEDPNVGAHALIAAGMNPYGRDPFRALLFCVLSAREVGGKNRGFPVDVDRYIQLTGKAEQIARRSISRKEVEAEFYRSLELLEGTRLWWEDTKTGQRTSLTDFGLISRRGKNVREGVPFTHINLNPDIWPLRELREGGFFLLPVEYLRLPKRLLSFAFFLNQYFALNQADRAKKGYRPLPLKAKTLWLWAGCSAEKMKNRKSWPGYVRTTEGYMERLGIRFQPPSWEPANTLAMRSYYIHPPEHHVQLVDMGGSRTRSLSSMAGVPEDGHQLLLAAQALGLTQRELAKTLGLSSSSVNRWIKDGRPLKREVREKVREAGLLLQEGVPRSEG